MESKMEKLYKSEINVFSVEDLASIWKISNRRRLLESIKHYTRTGRLKSIKRGLYIADKNYTELEIAQKAYSPSYVSLHTALGVYGVNFQYYNTIYSISLKTKTFNILESEYSYHAVDEGVFWNHLGIDRKTNYQIATVERAICDTMYLFPQTGFEHLELVNREKLSEVSKIYTSKAIQKRVKDLISYMKD